MTQNTQLHKGAGGVALDRAASLPAPGAAGRSDEMKTTLYDTGVMRVEGPRGRVIIAQTEAGIKVEHRSMYCGESYTEYYRTGEFPAIPDDWDENINNYNTSRFDRWLFALEGYTPWRTVRY